MQPTASVVTGIVEAGPIRPLGFETRNVAGAVVEALHKGDVVAATTTDEAGRFELRVQPGTYLIRAKAEGLHSKEPGRTVTVASGETLTVTFVLDTGIRCRWSHQPATCPLGKRCRWPRGSEQSLLRSPP